MTLAALPWIVANDAEGYASIGAASCPGTTLVQAVVLVADPGIVEVPMGTTLRELVRLGGSVTRGDDLQALVVGGPSGGILGSTALDTPYTFDDLRAAACSARIRVGAGGRRAHERPRACDPPHPGIAPTRRAARRFPCRIGLRRRLEVGDRLLEGTARPTDGRLLEDLAHDIVESALCDHERLATRPLVSGMRYFAPEIEQHRAARQPAGAAAPGSGPAH